MTLGQTAVSLYLSKDPKRHAEGVKAIHRKEKKAMEDQKVKDLAEHMTKQRNLARFETAAKYGAASVVAAAMNAVGVTPKQYRDAKLKAGVCWPAVLSLTMAHYDPARAA